MSSDVFYNFLHKQLTDLAGSYWRNYSKNEQVLVFLFWYFCWQGTSHETVGSTIKYNTRIHKIFKINPFDLYSPSSW